MSDNKTTILSQTSKHNTRTRAILFPKRTGSSSRRFTFQNERIQKNKKTIITVVGSISVLLLLWNAIPSTNESFSPEFLTIVTAVDGNRNQNQDHHRVAGLNCDKYGGPYTEESLKEMIYWDDIPSDVEFRSPLRHPTEEQYLTMEPDEGGWNNIRMGMETAVGIAILTGRTLVLPPKMQFYLLHHADQTKQHNNRYTFNDFFHFDSVQLEHKNGALKVITFEEFLTNVAMTGNFKDQVGNVAFPPKNRTNWNQISNYMGDGDGQQLWKWMRETAVPLTWNSDKCVAAFPSERGPEAANRMTATYLQKVLNPNNEVNPKPRDAWQRINSYNNNPTPVDAAPELRLDEILADRKELCVYDERLQNAKVIHTFGETRTTYRLLIHFYAFLFLENWKYDLWYKRFVRDHLRYVDEVQCAAARVIEKVRERARLNGSPDGTYDSFHIRRGDFQYEEMRHITADDIYNLNAKLYLQPNRTLFIATDESDTSFFKPLRDNYQVVFLHDFKDIIGTNISKNYYGMLDQLIASKGTTFFGAFYSTFTGYINRIRGYHHQKQKLPGHEMGIVNSYYYVPQSLMSYQKVMQMYRAVQPAFWQQEYAVCWRDIDHDLSIH